MFPKYWLGYFVIIWLTNFNFSYEELGSNGVRNNSKRGNDAEIMKMLKRC